MVLHVQRRRRTRRPNPRHHRRPAGAHLLRIGDFNVVEHQHVVRSRYDTNGAYLGAVQVSADAAESYAALAELAWQLATPFTTWWTSHPQYHRATRAA